MPILPSRFISNGPNRPQGPFEMNRGSLQAQGLECAYDVVGGRDIDLLSGWGISDAEPGVVGSNELGGVVVPVAGRLATARTHDLGASYSCLAWVRITTPDIHVVGGCSSSSAYMFAIYAGSNEIYHQPGGGYGSWGTSIGSGWHLYAVTNAATTVTLYADGRQVGSPKTLGSGTPTLESLSAYLSGSFPILGQFAGLRCYRRVITPAEIWHQYDPATRWDLYWQRSKTFFLPDLGAAPPASSPVPVIMQAHGLFVGGGLL